MKRLAAGLAFLFASAVTGAAAENLVVNPSFETVTGAFAGDGGVQLLVGSTRLTAWSVVGAEIAVLKRPNSYNLTPSDGVNFLDLTGYSSAGFPKGVSQVLTGLVPGQAYRFAVDVGIRNGACVGSGGCSGPVQVSASVGSTSATFRHNSVDPGNIWGRYGFDFTADGASMTLTIRGVSVPPGGAFIGVDNVSVTETAASVAPARVESVTGAVILKTPLATQAVTTGTGFTAGSLLQTGSNSTATLTFEDGTRLVVNPDTQVTLLPPTDAAVPETALSQVKGFLRHIRDTSLAHAGGYSVETPTGTVRPTGTDFSTRYTDTNHLGALVVGVQQGQVEVTDRRGHLTTLIAGAQASFEDAVPRVTPILPVTRGSVVLGKANAFDWTSFAGAAGYLIEYTLNPAGFAQPNAASVETPANTFRLAPGAFSESAGTVEYPLLLPGGVIPADTRVRWRVFATNAAGVILPGTTASDASVLTLRGSRVGPLRPADGSTLAGGVTATFAWTSYGGAAGYLFEYTLNPTGFAQANALNGESPVRTLRLAPGAYVESAGTVQLSVPVPAGLAPAGTRAYWRVFPLDAAGNLLPDVTASDARSVVLQ